jgi:hypothetical protein
MIHPNLLAIMNAIQHLRILRMVVAGQIENRQAKLTLVALADGPAQQVRDQVVPVTNTEDGNAGRQDFAFEGGAGIVVNAVGASGDDQAPCVRQIL